MCQAPYVRLADMVKSYGSNAVTAADHMTKFRHRKHTICQLCSQGDQHPNLLWRKCRGCGSPLALTDSPPQASLADMMQSCLCRRSLQGVCTTRLSTAAPSSKTLYVSNITKRQQGTAAILMYKIRLIFPPLPPHCRHVKSAF